MNVVKETEGRGKNERGNEEIVHWSPFIPFSKGTPETLITRTCEHTKNPTHQSGCGTHLSSHSNPFNTPPSCTDPNTSTNSPHCTKSTGTLIKGGHRVERWGSTHVERVLVDDDEGHAMCHQTTRVTWETETDSGWERMGDGREIRFYLNPKHRWKTGFMYDWIPKILLHSHTQISDSALLHQPPAIILSLLSSELHSSAAQLNKHSETANSQLFWILKRDVEGN